MNRLPCTLWGTMRAERCSTHQTGSPKLGIGLLAHRELRGCACVGSDVREGLYLGRREACARWRAVSGGGDALQPAPCDAFLASGSRLSRVRFPLHLSTD